MFCARLRTHPRSTLFPYTTLFRSFSDRRCTRELDRRRTDHGRRGLRRRLRDVEQGVQERHGPVRHAAPRDRKSTRLNSSHRCISYAVFCLKKKKLIITTTELAYTL